MRDCKKNILFVSKFFFVALPILWGVISVRKYGVNVCCWDEWSYMMNKDHFFSLNYLWAQHNEHRIFFQKLVTYIVGCFFSWNSKAFMYTSQIFLLFFYSVVILIVLNGKKIREISWASAFEIFILGLCIYNACQYENFLWGFQIGWIIIVSFGSLSFFLFESYIKTHKIHFLFFSMITAVVVSFSSMHGLGIWAAYIFIIGVTLITKEKLSLNVYLTVSLTAVCSIILYFTGWHSVSGHKLYFGRNLYQVFSFYFKLIGSIALRPESDSFCLVAGACFFMLIMVFLLKTFWEKNVLANIRLVGPEIMSLVALFSISLGRSGGGSLDGNAAISSRYTTNSMMFLTFFLLIIFNILHKTDVDTLSLPMTKKPESSGATLYLKMANHIFPKIAACISLCLPILILFNNLSMINTMKNVYEGRMWSKIILANYQNASLEDLNTLYPVGTENQQSFISMCANMEAEHLNVFSEDISELQFLEASLPDAEISEGLADSFFNSSSVSIEGGTIRLNLSQFGDYFDREKKDFDYFVSINDITYSAILNGGAIKFIKPINTLVEGKNSLQLIFGNKKKLVYTRKIFLYKSGEQIQIADNCQEDSSILSGFQKKSEEKMNCVDTINDIPFTENPIINTDQTNKISGWIQSDSANTTCYLKLNDVFFRLDWIERPDVISVYGVGYTGFSGNFFPESIVSGSYEASIVTVDNIQQVYYEQNIGSITVQ